MFGVVQDWFVYNVKTVFSTRLNPDDDARLSYGFKEMYCAADYRAIIKNQQETIKNENSQVLPACNPRMDVFRELTEILLDEVNFLGPANVLDWMMSWTGCCLGLDDVLDRIRWKCCIMCAIESHLKFLL